MHDEAFDYIRDAVDQYGPFRSVAEFGARNINGSVRYLFDEAERYVGVDIASGIDVDVVADAATWSTIETFNCVVCAEVLEHTDSAAEIVRNAARHLDPGGCFIMTCAGTGRAPHSAIDGGDLHDGEFYRNVDEVTLEAWLVDARFKKWQIDISDVDTRCIAWR